MALLVIGGVYVNQEFFRNNRIGLMNQIEDNSLVILFSGESVQRSEDELYPYTPNRNFFYLTGVMKERVVLLLTKVKGKVNEQLFIEKVDPNVEKWNGNMLSGEEAKNISGVTSIFYTCDFHSTLAKLNRFGTFKNVYLDLGRMTWQGPLSGTQTFASEITAKYPYLILQNVYPILCSLRRVKSKVEVERIQKAIDITEKGILAAIDHARPEMMEYELEAHYDFALKTSGVGPGFRSIIGSGKNATIMHYVENNNAVRENNLVLMDVGAEYGLYKADITRTFPINGKFTERQRKIYEIVLQAELKTIEAIKPGILHKELNEITKRILADGLKEIGVIKEDVELETYYFYNVSHYLGLDTHDVGEYDKLETNMVLTVEPGIYIPEESIGIRIEDDVLVTENGCEVLSKNIIKAPDEIEARMARSMKLQV